MTGRASYESNAAAAAGTLAKPPLVRRSSTGSSGERPPPQAPPPAQLLPPLHPAASVGAGVPLVRQISDASASRNHRSNQPSVDTAAGNETLGAASHATLDSEYLASALAESTSAIKKTHGISFHDDDSSMGSVVFHYAYGQQSGGGTPSRGGDGGDDDRDLPRNIGNRSRAGTADSGLTVDLDRSFHRSQQQQEQNSGSNSKAMQDHKHMPFGQYLPGGNQHQTNQQEAQPYNVRLSQRGGGQVLPLPPPPTASPMRKPPLSPAKTRGAVTIPKTPPSDFSSLSASTYTTSIGTRSGTGLRGVEYAELPGDRSPASGSDVPSIPGLGVDGLPAAEIKRPRTPLSRKKNANGHSPHGGWFNKLTSKMRGGADKSNTGSYGSIDDPKLKKEAKRYHEKNQAFLKRTERHRKMQRSGNVEQAAVMAAGSNHSRGFSAALDSIASISSEEEITDDEERIAGVHMGTNQSRPLIAESKEEEYLRRIRELEYENHRLLRVQAMEAEVQGYNAGYGTLPTAIPVTVSVGRATSDGLMMKNGDGAKKARVAIVAVIIILLVIALIYGIILCVLFLL